MSLNSVYYADIALECVDFNCSNYNYIEIGGGKNMSKIILFLLAIVLAVTLLLAGQVFADSNLTITSTASPFLLLLGTGTGSSIGGVFTPSAGWTTMSVAITSADAPGLAITDAGIGVGVLREYGGDYSLQYTAWDGNNWSAAADIATGVSTRTRPAICSTGTSAAVAFQGGDFKYYFAEYSSGGWSPTSEPVGGGASQNYGPNGPDIAVTGDDPTIAFVDAANNSALSARSRVSGTWGTTKYIGSSPSSNPNIWPSLIALYTGPELLMVYVNNSQQGMFSTRSSGVWSTPSTINNIFTNNSVALAPTANGGAVLAYREQDGKLYWSGYSSDAWSQPTAISIPNVSIITTPTLAQGIGTATAELVFINNTDNNAYHSRLIGSSWTTPVLIGSTIVNNAAIASFPTGSRPTTYDVTISNAPSANGIWSGGSPDIWTPNATGSNVAVSDIQTRQSAGTTVIISTNFGAGTESGDINVNASLSMSAVSITLMPARAVVINSLLTL